MVRNISVTLFCVSAGLSFITLAIAFAEGVVPTSGGGDFDAEAVEKYGV